MSTLYLGYSTSNYGIIPSEIFPRYSMEKNWKEAIKKVFMESATPLQEKDIFQQILSRGYPETDGGTPGATVNAKLTRSLKGLGEKSRC